MAQRQQARRTPAERPTVPHTILRLVIDGDDAARALLAEVTADPELREMFVGRLELHMAAAVNDAVFDLLPRREGIDLAEYDVTVEGDVVPGLVLAVQAALHMLESGGDVRPLLTAALARATNGTGRI